jgi:hypothetical protein
VNYQPYRWLQNERHYCLTYFFKSLGPTSAYLVLSLCRIIILPWHSLVAMRFYGFAGLGAKSAAVSAFGGSVDDRPLKLNF